MSNINIENNNNQFSNIDLLKKDFENHGINMDGSNRDYGEFIIDGKEIVFTLNNGRPTYCIIKNGKVIPILNQKGLDRNGTIDEYIVYTNYTRVGNNFYLKTDVINGEVKTGANKINPKSKEYYHILNDINFYDNSFYRSEYIRRAENWKGELDEETINNLVNFSDIKIKEFLYLKQEGLVNDELYNKYLPQVVDNLLEQCADTRYDVFKGEKQMYSVEIQGNKLVAVENAAQDINEEEIKYYFDNGFISAEIARKTLEIIAIRKKRDKEKESIRDTVKIDLDSTKIK